MSSADRATLAARLSDRGWTPKLKDVAELLALFDDADEDVAREAGRAVSRVDAQHAARVAELVVTAARAAARPARGRLTRFAGDMARELEQVSGDATTLAAWLREAALDADPKTRRAAARGLGKLRPTPEASAVLVEAFDRFPEPDDRKPLAEALGKVGGDAARAKLAEADGGEFVRARLVLERDAARTRPQEVAVDGALREAGVAEVRYHVRRGLEEVLIEELGPGARAKVRAPGLVTARPGDEARLADVLAPRVALDVGLPLTPARLEGDLAETVAHALGRPETKKLVRALTRGEGPARFRLAFRGGGHHRKSAWKVAELMSAEADPALVNDPTSSTWEVVVDEHEGNVFFELLPRAWNDDRFAYRGATVPASSHPTIAAALARVSPRRDDDVVWDPFAGAGAELVERARLGAYARLIGTDVEADAVAAARANLDAAGVRGASVTQGDAATASPAGVTAIISNPPMGRRVQRGGHLPLLELFVRHAGEVLADGGTLTWIVPEPKSIAREARNAGFVTERTLTVDMGGFAGELMVLRKRT